MISLDNAVDEFQDSCRAGDPEYGISDDDAAAGLRRVFAACNIAYEDDYGQRRAREERERTKRQAARVAAMTPEEYERYRRSPFEGMLVTMEEGILDSVFRSSVLIRTKFGRE
jgi:hypothetical protein